jgi:predicted phage tail protein
LTASTVAGGSGTVTGVNFFRETNGTSGLQASGANPDLYLGAGTSSAGRWTYTFSTANLAAGTYTYYARAVNSLGDKSPDGTAAISTTNVVKAATHAPAAQSGSTGSAPLAAATDLLSTGKLTQSAPKAASSVVAPSISVAQPTFVATSEALADVAAETPTSGGGSGVASWLLDPEGDTSLLDSLLADGWELPA